MFFDTKHTDMFVRITDNVKEENEGGEVVVKKSNASFRNKANFDQGRGGRLNKNQLQGARVFKAIILLACNFEGWFKVAYIATEISFAANVQIMLVYWPHMWTIFLPSHPVKNLYSRVCSIILHILPIVTTVTDLWMTDMALEKTHWWITFIVVFPVYALANWFFSYRLGSTKNPGELGHIYGFEEWDDAKVYTLFVFFVGACIQGGMYYCICAIIEKYWPKRPEEEYDLLQDEKPAENETNEA